MVSEDSSQWYTNKELFIQINNMQGDFRDFRSEMKETREMIKKYNGLREDMAKNKDILQDEVITVRDNLRKELKEANDEISLLKEMQQKALNKSLGRVSVGQGIREWGGWIIALIVLIEKFI